MRWFQKKRLLNIKLVGFGIRRRLLRDRDFLLTRQLCLQRIGNGFRDVTFNREKVRQLRS